MALLIHNALKVILYTQIILNFIIFAQYLFFNEKTFHYSEYALYRLENNKIAFEYYKPIDFKLY